MVELRHASQLALDALMYGNDEKRAKAMLAIRKALIRTPDNFEQCARRLFNSQAWADELTFALSEANREIESLEEKLERLKSRHKRLREKIRGIETNEE